MKISIFVPYGNEGNDLEYWQYAYKEAINSYLDFADEVVIVGGRGGNWTSLPESPKLKLIPFHWEYDFSWEKIAQSFNAGLEACTGDWIIKMDIDYIIHEQYMDNFRKQLEVADVNGFELASYMKTTVLNKDEYYLKLAVPFCIKKSAREKYKFGIPLYNTKSAWGYPIIAEGFDEKRGLPTGRDLPEPVDNIAFRTGVEIYNYDNTFRNKEITAEHFLRFSKARVKAGFPSWGDTREKAMKVFVDMFDGRMKKTKGIRKQFVNTGGHPKYIKERIEKLTPDLFGYNMWK